MSNTIKDLLRDLVFEAKTTEMKNREELIEFTEQYYDRFIKEIGKYFELGDKNA